MFESAGDLGVPKLRKNVLTEPKVWAVYSRPHTGGPRRLNLRGVAILSAIASQGFSFHTDQRIRARQAQRQTSATSTPAQTPGSSVRRGRTSDSESVWPHAEPAALAAAAHTS